MRKFAVLFALAPTVLFFSLAPLVLSGCGKQDAAVDPQVPSVPTTSVSDHVVYTFVAPIAFDELATTLDQNHVAVNEIRLQTNDFTAGFTVGGKPLASIRDQLFAEHRKFLEMMASRSAERDAPSGTDWSSYLAAANDAKITSITCRTSLPTALEQSLGARPAGSDATSTEGMRSRPTDPPQAPDSYSHERWAACSGWSKVTQGMSYQEFRFNSVSDFQSGNRTYEHETHIWDPNFVAYDNYWSSNMPNAYHDTGFHDREETYTVGCARADLLQVGTIYWTFMAFRPQGSSTSLGKIKGQIGHRTPSWCYSTWCIWGDAATDPGYAYLAYPNYGVNWTY